MTLWRGWRSGLGAGLVLCAGVLCGCEKDEVRVYTIPKSMEHSPDHDHHDHADHAAPAAPAFAAPATTGTRPWTAPEGWTELPDNPAMRLATYVSPGPTGTVEIAISTFPGEVGGLLANVNRWRGQIGLAPVGDGDLASIADPMQIPGFRAHLVRLHGAENDLIAASLYDPRADVTWFVRSTTDAESAPFTAEAIAAFARSFAGGEMQE